MKDISEKKDKSEAPIRQNGLEEEPEETIDKYKEEMIRVAFDLIENPPPVSNSDSDNEEDNVEETMRKWASFAWRYSLIQERSHHLKKTKKLLLKSYPEQNITIEDCFKGINTQEGETVSLADIKTLRFILTSQLLGHPTVYLVESFNLTHPPKDLPLSENMFVISNDKKIYQYQHASWQLISRQGHIEDLSFSKTSIQKLENDEQIGRVLRTAANTLLEMHPPQTRIDWHEAEDLIKQYTRGTEKQLKEKELTIQQVISEKEKERQDKEEAIEKLHQLEAKLNTQASQEQATQEEGSLTSSPSFLPASSSSTSTLPPFKKQKTTPSEQPSTASRSPSPSKKD